MKQKQTMQALSIRLPAHVCEVVEQEAARDRRPVASLGQERSRGLGCGSAAGKGREMMHPALLSRLEEMGPAQVAAGIRTGVWLGHEKLSAQMWLDGQAAATQSSTIGLAGLKSLLALADMIARDPASGRKLVADLGTDGGTAR
jgi:hypothetical protein